jgi:hypothetical protein
MYLPPSRTTSFPVALTRLLLRSTLSKIYLALGARRAVSRGVAECPFYCKMAVETWLTPAVFSLHEATQYVLLGSEVELKLGGGYVVLEPRGRPRRPRLALVAGIAASAAVGAATWFLAPMFSTIIFIANSYFVRYVGD